MPPHMISRLTPCAIRNSAYFQGFLRDFELFLDASGLYVLPPAGLDLSWRLVEKSAPYEAVTHRMPRIWLPSAHRRIFRRPASPKSLSAWSHGDEL
jgi:hypothetical protein